MNALVRKYQIIILLSIFLVGAFLRIYKLGEVPNGLYQDETAIGYNAYSILTTGNDEYGKRLPLYFKSFGDHKLPVYIYSVVVSEKLFGINAFAVRFPSALFGSLTIISFFFFVRILTKNHSLSLVATTLLAISPWMLHYNRATFEVSICIFLLVTGGYLLLKAFDNKRFGLFLLGTVLFILCLYSYNLTRLLSPILYLAFLIINLDKLKQISLIEKVSTGIISLILLIPFAMTIFGSGGASSAGGTFLFSSNFVKAPLLEFRSYFIEFPLFSKIFFNSYVLLFWQYIQNIITYFATPFLFINGSTHGNHGIGNMGELYLFEFPLIIIGTILLFIKKIKGRVILLSWGVISILVASLTRDIPQATRSIFLVIPLEVLSAIGLIYITQICLALKNKYIKVLLVSLGVALVSYSMIFYFASYYVRFPVLYAKNWNQQDEILVNYIVDNESKYDRIIFDSKSGFVYSSYLFYSKYLPSSFYNLVKRLPDDNEGFSKVENFGKIYFRDIDWNVDAKSARTLIITNKNNKPTQLLPIATFDYPTRPVVISIQERIAEFPVTDNAYMLVEGRE